MYWDNTWVNTFNYKNFFNKTLFLGNILYFLFSEKIFKFFFLNDKKKNVKNFFFFKSDLLFKKRIKSIKLKKKKSKVKRYNFTRIWFIKFNNFVLFTTFVLFYLKIMKKKKKMKRKLKTAKNAAVFWKKKKGFNFKKKAHNRMINNYLVF